MLNEVQKIFLQDLMVPPIEESPKMGAMPTKISSLNLYPCPIDLSVIIVVASVHGFTSRLLVQSIKLEEIEFTSKLKLVTHSSLLVPISLDPIKAVWVQTKDIYESKDIPYRVVIWLKNRFFHSSNTDTHWVTISISKDLSVMNAHGMEYIDGVTTSHIFYDLFMPLYGESASGSSLEVDESHKSPYFGVPSLGRGDGPFSLNMEITYVTSCVDDSPLVKNSKDGVKTLLRMPALSSSTLNLGHWAINMNQVDKLDHRELDPQPRLLPRQLPHSHDGDQCSLRLCSRIRHTNYLAFPTPKKTRILRNVALIHPITGTCYFLGLIGQDLYLVTLGQHPMYGRVIIPNTLFEYELVQVEHFLIRLRTSSYITSKLKGCRLGDRQMEPLSGDESVIDMHFTSSDKILILLSTGRHVSVKLGASRDSRPMIPIRYIDAPSRSLISSDVHLPTPYTVQNKVALLERLQLHAEQAGIFDEIAESILSPYLFGIGCRDPIGLPNPASPLILRIDPLNGHMIVGIHGSDILIKWAKIGAQAIFTDLESVLKLKARERIMDIKLFTFDEDKKESLVVVLLEDCVDLRDEKTWKIYMNCFVISSCIQSGIAHVEFSRMAKLDRIAFEPQSPPKNLCFHLKSKTLLWISDVSSIASHALIPEDGNFFTTIDRFGDAVLGIANLNVKETWFYPLSAKTEDIHGLVVDVFAENSSGKLLPCSFKTIQFYLIISDPRFGQAIHCRIYQLRWSQMIRASYIDTRDSSTSGTSILASLFTSKDKDVSDMPGDLESDVPAESFHVHILRNVPLHDHNLVESTGKIRACQSIDLWNEPLDFPMDDKREEMVYYDIHRDPSISTQGTVFVCTDAYGLRSLFLIIDPTDSSRYMHVLFEVNSWNQYYTSSERNCLSTSITVPHQKLPMDFLFSIQPENLVSIFSKDNSHNSLPPKITKYLCESFKPFHLSYRIISIKKSDNHEYPLQTTYLSVSHPMSSIPLYQDEEPRAPIYLEIQHSAVHNGFFVVDLSISTRSANVLFIPFL
jgi:hypothetical protein